MKNLYIALMFSAGCLDATITLINNTHYMIIPSVQADVLCYNVNTENKITRKKLLQSELLHFKNLALHRNKTISFDPATHPTTDPVSVCNRGLSFGLPRYTNASIQNRGTVIMLTGMAGVLGTIQNPQPDGIYVIDYDPTDTKQSTIIVTQAVCD